MERYKYNIILHTFISGTFHEAPLNTLIKTIRNIELYLMLNRFKTKACVYNTIPLFIINIKCVVFGNYELKNVSFNVKTINNSFKYTDNINKFMQKIPYGCTIHNK